MSRNTDVTANSATEHDDFIDSQSSGTGGGDTSAAQLLDSDEVPNESKKAEQLVKFLFDWWQVICAIIGAIFFAALWYSSVEGRVGSLEENHDDQVSQLDSHNNRISDVEDRQISQDKEIEFIKKNHADSVDVIEKIDIKLRDVELNQYKFNQIKDPQKSETSPLTE